MVWDFRGAQRRFDDWVFMAFHLGDFIMTAVTHWKLQRISAVLLVVTSILMAGILYLMPGDYMGIMQTLNGHRGMEIKTLFLVFIGLVSFHGYLGIGEILTDYVHGPFALKASKACSLIFFWGSFLIPVYCLITL